MSIPQVSKERVLRALARCPKVLAVYKVPCTNSDDPLLSVLIEMSWEDMRTYYEWYHSRHRNQPLRIHRGIVALEYIELDLYDQDVFYALNTAFWHCKSERDVHTRGDVHIDLYPVPSAWRSNRQFIDTLPVSEQRYFEEYCIGSAVRL